MVEPLVMKPGGGGYEVDGDADRIVALVRQATELGADLVKADPTDDLSEYRRVVVAARVPVLVRGGGRVPDDELLDRTRAVLDQGAAGIVYGRNVIQHPDPTGMVRALRPWCTGTRLTAARVRVGIVGGGLMGRELAAAIGRWAALEDHPVRPELVAVCDTNPAALSWFDRVDSVRLRSSDYADLLADDELDVLYIALPHHLHEAVYLDAIEAGKDFLAEKPFGIDLAAATRIVEALHAKPDVFVRCSSEMPFFPAPSSPSRPSAPGAPGEVISLDSDFLHSSDLDRSKPINWKRQARYCGEIGVMGDLGMHVAHVPLRLGCAPGRCSPSSRT